MESQWMKVELLGHRVHLGLVDEVEIFGAKMGRVRIPGVRRGDECRFCRGKGTTQGWGDEQERCTAGCDASGRMPDSDPEWIDEVMFSASAIYALSACTEADARRESHTLVGRRRRAAELVAAPVPAALPAASDSDPIF